MKMHYTLFIVCLLACQACLPQLSAQPAQGTVSVTGSTGSANAAELLQSGPMLGYSTMREVLVWAQTKAPATVHISYRPKGSDDAWMESAPVQTEAHSAYTAKCIAITEPGITYEYRLHINQEEVPRPYALEFQSQQLWQYRSPAPDFTMALGSCLYVNDPPYDRPGRGYGGEYAIVEAIHKDRPDMMLWLGDNTYLREPDWNSRTGFHHRHTHTRSLEELQPLLGSTHHYALWDDHDYGPNDSDRGFWNKDLALEVFNDFWGNPNYNLTGQGGITGTFVWNDVQFFLLDNRWFRSPNNSHLMERTYLGEAQMRWLLDALTYSKATFKVICIGGQTINSVSIFENYARYARERHELIDAIAATKAEGVLFLSGDRHHTELSKMTDIPGFYPLYDLTVSPLTSGVHDPGNEGNKWQVPNTIIVERNYALVQVTGDRDDRRMEISIRSVEGKELWRRSIEAKELQVPEEE